MKLAGWLFFAIWLLFAIEGRAAEKVRVAYPAVAPGLAPSWVTADADQQQCSIP
jgi:hypothetical protein